MNKVKKIVIDLISNDYIVGDFELSDETHTQFDISIENGWTQWGNSWGNMEITSHLANWIKKQFFNE